MNETFDKKNAFDALFLDRDGVINQRIPEQYVHRWEDFIFLENVLDALALLAPKFKYIFVVTNQQGIGKGRMTEAALQGIHERMVEAVHGGGGRIDAVYYCPHLEAMRCGCRKPGVGMAMQAKRDFVAVEWGRSVMVGDFLSDIQMGKALGMHTIFINTAHDLSADQQAEAISLSDAVTPSLWEWAKHW